MAKVRSIDNFLLPPFHLFSPPVSTAPPPQTFHPFLRLVDSLPFVNTISQSTASATVPHASDREGHLPGPKFRV